MRLGRRAQVVGIEQEQSAVFTCRCSEIWIRCRWEQEHASGSEVQIVLIQDVRVRWRGRRKNAKNTGQSSREPRYAFLNIGRTVPSRCLGAWVARKVRLAVGVSGREVKISSVARNAIARHPDRAQEKRGVDARVGCLGVIELVRRAARRLRSRKRLESSRAPSQKLASRLVGAEVTETAESSIHVAIL